MKSDLDRVLEAVLNSEGEDRQKLAEQFADVLKSEHAMRRTQQQVAEVHRRVTALEAALAVVRSHQEDDA